MSAGAELIPTKAQSEIFEQQRAEQLRLLCAQLPLGMGLSLTLAAVYAAVMWVSAPHGTLLIWFIALTIVNAWRWTLFAEHRRLQTASSDAVLSLQFTMRIGAFLGGLAWGLTPWLFYPQGNLSLELFNLWVLAGVMAGAATNLAADWWSASAFQLAAVVPFAAFLAMTGFSLHWLMDVTVLLYGVLAIVSTRRMSRQIGDNIELRLEATHRERQLSKLISEVVRSAETVGATASALADNNSELNDRTQQQATTVRDTAVSMEQITILGKNNADNADNADRLGQQARELATSAEGVVSQAVRAMSLINTGGAKISNIISMINEIAFQTNLLALNAAVEAARAGEHGRGFAVVATEVRALAQRSAGAAKQIKVLITDSADSIHAGTELVNRSGNALSQIQDSVREMTDLIKQIAASSREQAQGARRINEALLHLDKSTRQNALLVEGGSTVAHNLRDQATALMQQAAYFTVADASAGSQKAMARSDVDAQVNRGEVTANVA